MRRTHTRIDGKNSISIAVDKVVLLQCSPRKILHFQFVRGATNVRGTEQSVKRVRRQLGTEGLLLRLPSTAAAGSVCRHRSLGATRGLQWRVKRWDVALL